MSCNRGRHFLFRVPLVIAFILLKGAVVMALWNALIPELFHAPALHYGQAIGLMILAKLLIGFGPFGRFGGGPPFRGRWMHFSPEEREKLRQEFHRRHCGGDQPETPAAP